jgi:hypothetical protein
LKDRSFARTMTLSKSLNNLGSIENLCKKESSLLSSSDEAVPSVGTMGRRHQGRLAEKVLQKDKLTILEHELEGINNHIPFIY